MRVETSGRLSRDRLTVTAEQAQRLAQVAQERKISRDVAACALLFTAKEQDE
jgi:hypothetical protein